MSNNLRGRMRGLRKSKGFTIPELADLTGIAARTLSNYELGHREPTLGFLARLCQETGGDLLELIDLQLKDAGIRFNMSRVSDQPGQYESAANLAPLRQSLAGSKMPPEWLMFMVELVAKGMVTIMGAQEIAAFFDDWQPSEQWLREMEN